MRLLIAFLIMAFSYIQTVHAECKETSAQVGISASFGIQPGGPSYDYRYNFLDGTINTTIVYGGGLNIGNIHFLLSSRIGFAIEFMTIPMKVDRVERSDGATAEYDGRGIPIILWGEVSQPGKFGPFVRFGVGTIHLEFSTRYDPLPRFNHDFDYWSFAYGYGGGLRYLISKKVECLLVAEGYRSTDSSESTNEYGRTSKSEAPFILVFHGFRVRYWF